MADLWRNEPLVAALLAWFIAQVLKAPFSLLRERRFDLTRLVESGGMPSSHTALVVALSYSVGINYGLDSPLFAIAAVFSGVVMYDAAGVRRAAGKQAEILNIIISEFQHHEGIRGERLKELLGHTPFEVLVGALLGLGVAAYLH